MWDYEDILRRLNEETLRACERRFLDPDADYDDDEEDDDDDPYLD
jgi:hypothetical protein